MRSMTPMIGLIGLALAANLDAQTIYKCTTAEGTVYAQLPCDGAGGSMETFAYQHQPVPQMADLRRAEAAAANLDAQIRARQSAHQESVCIDNMASATRVGAGQRIASYRARIAQLEASMARSANTLAGATRDGGIRTEIAAYESAIGNEKNIAAQVELNARSICAARRMRADAP